MPSNRMCNVILIFITVFSDLYKISTYCKTNDFRMKTCTQPLWYHDRKNGKGRGCPLHVDKLRNKTAYEKTVFKTKSLGREYMSNDEVFQYLESLLSKIKTNTNSGVSEARKAYLYIISKQIGDEVYYKLGLSEKPNLSRIVGAQTFLIPGLGKDIGFRVHMILTFTPEDIGNSDQLVHYYIENMCHKILRFYFKASNLKFGNDESSEWYLIPENYGVYFCGFILDIVATFAYSSKDALKKLSPQNIWIFSENKPFREIKLPPSHDVETRLKKDDRYKQVDDVVHHFGLRHIRAFSNTLTVDIQPLPSDKLQAKGTQDLFSDELLGSEGIPITYSFPDSNLEFILKKIIKNQHKFAIGQPLQTGEIYGVITATKDGEEDYNTLPKDVFENKKIQLIPYATDSSGEFVDFCIHISDLLEIVKSIVSMDSWRLKDHYQYYKDRKDSTTKKKIVITNNFVAPQWYFHEGIQKKFARKFVKESALQIQEQNSKWTSEKKGKNSTPLYRGVVTPQKKTFRFWEHKDTSLTDSSIMYTWTLTGQSILKEQPHEDDTKNRIRSAYFLVRSRQQGNTTVTEEVPVVRLMHLWKVKESDLDEEEKTSRFLSNKRVEISEDLVLEENHHILIPKGLLFQSLEDDGFDSTVLVFIVKNIYSKRYEANEEMVHVQGMIKFPLEEVTNQLHMIMVSDMKMHVNKIEIIEEHKLKVGQVIKAKPSKLEGFGEEDTDKNKYHYAKIVDIQIDYDWIYKIQYFPPFDKFEPWPIPKSDKEALKARKHSNPRGKNWETWDRKDLENPYVHVVKQKDKKEKESFEKYKKKLNEYRLPVDKVVSHLPTNAKTMDDVKEYHVVFGNRSKGKIPADDLGVDLEDAYWTKSPRKTRKKGGRKRRKTRKSQ